ncbi:MAG: universal stress protein [Aerococcus sp.]|nr:universal stress protein [Aerococcus sp.]
MLETISKILVPVDDSKQSEYAAAQAARIAKTSGASLTFINVIRENESLAHVLTADEREAIVRAREKLLTDHQARATTIFPDLHSSTKVHFGDARQIILNQLETNDYQLIIMGATGKSAFKRVLIGSVAQFITRHSPVPVLLVRHDTANKKLLVPTDASKPSERALQLATDLGKVWESAIDLLTVTEDLAFYNQAYDFRDYRNQVHDDAKSFLQPIASKYADDDDLTLTTHIIDGDPRLEILKFAQSHRIDTIVMGASGKGSVKRIILGSVSEYVVMHAESNVLIIH